MGASGAGIGDGLANAEAIVAWHVANGHASEAYSAQPCADLSCGGHDDWFLPSLAELRAMRANLHAAGNGDFLAERDGGYWCSTEISTFAYIVWFASGAYNNGAKTSGSTGYPMGTRAARRF
jgi:hypothetical protein